MALRYYANSPATALTSSCSALATTITVDSVTGLPISYPYTLIIDRGQATEEAVEVTGAAGTTLTVTRGIDDTTAFAHAASAEVVHGITARDIREPNAHVNAESNVHGISGKVVGTEDVQTLANKNLSSGTNIFPASLVTRTGTQTLTNKTLTSPTITGVGQTQFATKASPTGREGTTTYSADPHLVLAVVANATYEVRVDIAIQDNNGGFKGRISFPSGTFMFQRQPVASPLEVYTHSGLSGGEYPINTGAKVTGLLFVGGTAGNVTLDWAQYVSSGQTTYLWTGSSMTLRRLA